MSEKVDFFFRLLRGVYGAAKISATWPTDMDLQIAQKIWSELIEKHNEAELSNAIKNAQSMMATGEDDWQWPNIGLILSGAKLPKPPGDIIARIQEDRRTALPHDEQQSRAQELLSMLRGA